MRECYLHSANGAPNCHLLLKSPLNTFFFLNIVPFHNNSLTVEATTSKDGFAVRLFLLLVDLK